MNADTEQLIGSLAHGLQPVRPMLPPAVRSLLWLAGAALAIALAVLGFANLDVFAARSADPRLALECAAILLTGVSAVMAAFHLSLPDRSELWRYAPLPPLALWIGTSSLGCLRNGLGLGASGDRLGESPHCFAFIIAVSVPFAALLYLALRRARPLQPLPVALYGALGVAALAAFTLQFFHPFDTTLIDFALHAAAVLVVLALGAATRRALD
jgi:hypothetical protein